MQYPVPTIDFENAVRAMKKWLPAMSVPELAAQGIDASETLSYEWRKWCQLKSANCYGFGLDKVDSYDPGQLFFAGKNLSSEHKFYSAFAAACGGGRETFGRHNRFLQAGLRVDGWTPAGGPAALKGNLIAVFARCVDEPYSNKNPHPHDYHVYALRREDERLSWLFQPGFRQIDIQKCHRSKDPAKDSPEDVFEDARRRGYLTFMGFWQKPLLPAPAVQ